MIRYLYTILQWLYKNGELKDYIKVFDYYNEDTISDEALQYPALFVKINKNDEHYLPGNIVYSDLKVEFHLFLEFKNDIRENDNRMLNSIKQLLLQELINATYDGFKKDLQIIPSGITNDSNYYSFGTLDHRYTEIDNIDGFKHIIMTYGCMMYDSSALYTTNPTLNIKTITDLTSSGNTYKLKIE